MCVILAIEVNLKHRVFRPVLFECLHLQPLEKVLAALEIILECRDEQRLAEAAGTTEEINALNLGQLIDQCSLVNIDKIILDDACKVLYADRILFHILLFLANLQKIVGTREILFEIVVTYGFTTLLIEPAYNGNIFRAELLVTYTIEKANHLSGER